jgi:hypothetical protein
MVTSVSFPAPASVLSGSPRSDGSHKHFLAQYSATSAI